VSPEGTAVQSSYAPELQELEESLQGVSICEVLDRVLNKGVVVAGEVIISLAGVDLVYLGLNLVLTSIETARGSLMNGKAPNGQVMDMGKGDTNGYGRNNAGRV
jgi:hypothetical protein